MSTTEPPSSPFVSAPLPSPTTGLPPQHFSFPPMRAGAATLQPPMSPAYWTETSLLQRQQGSQLQEQAMNVDRGQPESEETEMTDASQQCQQRAPIQSPRQAVPQQQQQQQQQQLGDPSGSFLRDFNLVAEAAKRAQVACLMRDLGDVALS